MSNNTETPALTGFLLARIAEDEAAARTTAGQDHSEGRWTWQSHRLPPYRSALVNERGVVVLPSKNDDVYPSASVAEHIARHDPARVLAECEAKRRIVLAADRNDEPTEMHLSALTLEWVVQHLALPYSDHPDYRDEWKP